MHPDIVNKGFGESEGLEKGLGGEIVNKYRLDCKKIQQYKLTISSGNTFVPLS